MDYHIARNGQQIGVLSETQIQANLRNGSCQLSDMAWQEGMADWKPLSELFPEVAVLSSPPVPQAPKAVPRVVAAPNSGLSIASLVCGLLTLATCILTGIPAIICGHMALSKIKKSGGAIGGKGMAITGLVLGYLSIFVAIFSLGTIFTVGAEAYKRGADRAKSKIDARQIVLMCRDYASKHEGKYPETLEVLVEEGSIKEAAIGNFEYFGATMKEEDPLGSIVLISKSTGTGGKKIIARHDGSVAEEDPPRN